MSALAIYAIKLAGVTASYIRGFEKTNEFSEQQTDKFRQDLKKETEIFLENIIVSEFEFGPIEMKQFRTNDYPSNSMDLHELVAERLITPIYLKPEDTEKPENLVLDDTCFANLRKEFTANLMTSLADFKKFRVSKRLANIYWRAVSNIFMEVFRNKKPDLYMELNLYQTTLDRRDVSFFGLVYNDKHNPSDWSDA